MVSTVTPGLSAAISFSSSMIRRQQTLVDVVREAGVELGAMTADQMDCRRHRQTASRSTPRARPDTRATVGVGELGERGQRSGGVGQHPCIGGITDDGRERAVEVAGDE